MMSKNPIFDDETTRYLDRKGKTRPSAPLPNIVDDGPAGRAYVKPCIPQFRLFEDLKSRVKFWKR